MIFIRFNFHSSTPTPLCDSVVTSFLDRNDSDMCQHFCFDEKFEFMIQCMSSLCAFGPINRVYEKKLDIFGNGLGKLTGEEQTAKSKHGMQTALTS